MKTKHSVLGKSHLLRKRNLKIFWLKPSEFCWKAKWSHFFLTPQLHSRCGPQSTVLCAKHSSTQYSAWPAQPTSHGFPLSRLLCGFCHCRQDQWNGPFTVVGWETLTLLVLALRAVEFQSWLPSGNSWVLGLKELTETHLSCDCATCNEHKTAFRLSPRSLFSVWSSVTSGLKTFCFYAVLRLMLSPTFSWIIFEEEKEQRTSEGGAEKAQPRLRQSRPECMPRQEARTACYTNPLLSPLRLGANISERNSYHYSHVIQSE